MSAAAAARTAQDPTRNALEGKKAEMAAAMAAKREEMARMGAEFVTWLAETPAPRAVANGVKSASKLLTDVGVQTDKVSVSAPWTPPSAPNLERTESSLRDGHSSSRRASLNSSAGGDASSVGSPAYNEAQSSEKASALRNVLSESRRMSVKPILPPLQDDHGEDDSHDGGSGNSALDRHIMRQRKLSSVITAADASKGKGRQTMLEQLSDMQEGKEGQEEDEKEEEKKKEEVLEIKKVEIKTAPKEQNMKPKQSLSNQKMEAAFELARASKANGDKVIHLPRGGNYVNTRLGPLQIGIPPETIKDCMLLGLQLPKYYIVPKERFNRRAGINVAEFEFPTYFNFFVLRGRVNLITDAETEHNIRAVMQETLFGPKDPNKFLDREFEADLKRKPDLAKELGFFRMNPFNPTERMEIDTLINFIHFNDRGEARIGEGADEVVVRYQPDEYTIEQGGEIIATVSDIIDLRSHVVTETSSMHKLFDVPLFGCTFLGTSHGFDPAGSTTGFVLWMNGRGIMVDPPPNSGALLRSEGIPGRLIDAVILTHCHADHDAGTFQKIVDEQRVTIMTTPTIMGSFMRKYAAISGLEEELLRRLFVFQEILPGEKIKIHGGTFRFQYSMHSIPCMGFKVEFGGASLVYSADTCYMPDKIAAIYDKGILSAGRRDSLLNFPWDSTVILHEAGVPPIHTPATELGKLPPDVRERIYCVHTAAKDFPWDTGLKIASCGVENTIVIDVDLTVVSHSSAIAVIDLVASLDLFRPFPMLKAIDVLQCYRRESYEPGQDLNIAQHDKFAVIETGLVRYCEQGNSKILTTGDYFGEVNIVMGKHQRERHVTCMCLTKVQLVTFQKEDFLCLIRQTDAEERIMHLVNMRTEMSWDILNRNRVLSKTTESQKTQLQGIMMSRVVKEGDFVWRKGEMAQSAILVKQGSVGFTNSSIAFGPGAFLGEVDLLVDEDDLELNTSIVAFEDAEVYMMHKEALVDFFMYNPGVLLNFVGQLCVE